MRKLDLEIKKFNSFMQLSGCLILALIFGYWCLHDNDRDFKIQAGKTVNINGVDYKCKMIKL